MSTLRTGTLVDAALIAAPKCTKSKTGERDPLMYLTKKGKQWHFGMMRTSAWMLNLAYFTPLLAPTAASMK